MNRDLELALTAECYRSPWGVVIPYPRLVHKLGRHPLRDPAKVTSRGYGHFRRYRQRRKPLFQGFGRHGLYHLEEHLKKLLAGEPKWAVNLLVARAEHLFTGFRSYGSLSTPRRAAALAFFRLWRESVTFHLPSCAMCRSLRVPHPVGKVQKNLQKVPEPCTL